MTYWVRRHLDRHSNLSEQMPVDVLPASKGEFIPPPPTPQQRQVMALQDDAAEEVRHKLGMSRRTSVRSASAIGVGFCATNHAMPGQWGRYQPANAFGESGRTGDDA